jgi:hypothetical protein
MNKKFKNYLAVSWEQVLCDNDDIIELFKILEIKGLKNIQTLSRTYSDEGRMIMNITAENTKDKILQIIIDATPGIPTWGQFINLTYDQGEAADMRIILYGEDCKEYRNDFTAGGLIEIANLVRRNNKCRVTTYLVKGIVFDSNGRKFIHECSIEEGPDEASVDPNQTFPSKRQIQESEFWAGYYFPQWWTDPVGNDDDIINCWAPGYSLRNDLKTEASWNDDGFFIKLIEEQASDAIDWIWKNKKSELEEAYPDCDITLEKIDENLHAISVRILNISMTDLIKMSPDEKWDYGEYVFGQEHNFQEIADGVVDGYDDSMKAAKAM